MDKCKYCNEYHAEFKVCDEYIKTLNTASDVPIVPPLTDEEKRRRQNPDPNPDVAQCGECGMAWKQVMGYVCGNPNCPMQPFTTC